MKMITRLSALMCGILFAWSLTGCVATQTGSTIPDYAMIEFGSVAVFTVIVNEVKVSDEKVLEAYKGLESLEKRLESVGDDSVPMDLSKLDEMFAAAVPLEYKALAAAGSKLIRDRVQKHLGNDLPSVDLGEHGEMVKQITLSVVKGAKAAMLPRASTVRRINV